MVVVVVTRFQVVLSSITFYTQCTEYLMKLPAFASPAKEWGDCPIA